MRSILALSVLFVLYGCRTGTLPNPNDPKDVGMLSPQVMRRNLASVTESLANRHARRELTDREYRDLVTKAANELLESVDPSNVAPAQAWEFGEVLRDGKRWPEAEKVLRTAVKYAVSTKNEDRRVNDTLRLARAIAEQGRTEEAIKTARTVFDASPVQSAPILLGVYLEIVPAVHEPKGHEVELAKLIEDAIAIHMRTLVDKGTEAGKLFLAARAHHVAAAWRVASALYDAGGRHDAAMKALEKSDAMVEGFSRRTNI
ncbi:hypothetical protein [Fimbriimonas ginsengisoli]|uniref:Tetratricopeptide repeat protein n=1 Tax=Fimbriimonas ginsengisoli Gsoil 348 TaxID=661478 RepID=A0A068NNS3_FIMGI|nr:hypothetical protein [Fimbriimonas ginsengisoli]AIE85213.1 hypothetical protein OP10G_1845 [Fimbriimonas ginsengisoli Gsoil 348]